MSVTFIDLRRVKRVFVFVVPSLLLVLSIIVGGGELQALRNGIVKDNKPYTVIIDPGHGGEDPGAVAEDGTLEKDLNLSISMLIGEGLKEKGIEVVYTRIEDKMLYSEDQNIKGLRKLSDLKNRVAVAKGVDNPLFISIHMNSYGAKSLSGLQVFYSPYTGSEELGNGISSSVKASFPSQRKRPLKKGEGIYVLEKAVGPAVLIECGFITNPEECKKLSQKEFQKELSSAIICGIIEYMNKK